MQTTTGTKASLVTFLLDRSQSMDLCYDATIEGFNGYLSTLQRETDAHIDFTFLQFDSVSLDKVCVAVPVRMAPTLSRANYQPRGSTPLIEASIKTIQAVKASLATRTDNPKVVICIQTDGQENCSGVEYTWDALKTLIAEMQGVGWEFTFLGAGINAYQQGARMGIPAVNTMSYRSDDMEATAKAFASTAGNAASFSAGRSASAAYSRADRFAAKDAFAPPDLAAQVQPMPPSVPLDLSKGVTQTSVLPSATLPDLKI